MSERLFYREIQFSRLGGALPEKVGSFVVGIPTKTIEAYRKEHAGEGMDAIFRNLISEKEKQHMADLLGLVNPSLEEQIPFDGEPITLGAPALMGEEAERFGKFSKPINPGCIFLLQPERNSLRRVHYFIVPTSLVQVIGCP